MSSAKRVKESAEDMQLIVEEKIVKVGGETTIRKYAKGRFLGKGGFAKCYEFTNLETKKVSASKVIDKAGLAKNRAKQKLMSEIRIHRSLHHPNIVAFEHFFEDSKNVYILLELCQNQTLNELLRRRKRLTELEVQCYTLHLISGMKYLHSHRVIHRDLKLGNLFLTDKMELKIGDFGLATKLEFEGDRKRTVCGTPNYIAPEILDGKQGHSYEVDIWSLGVIIYTLLIGKPPFETSDVKTTYKRIKMNAYTFPEHIIISESARDLITKVLNLDPTRRPTLDQILEHKFFNSGNTIPKLLPSSTLACPPSSSYVKQFTGVTSASGAERPRLESTAPIKMLGSLRDSDSKKVLSPGRQDTLKMTARASLATKTDANNANEGKIICNKGDIGGEKRGGSNVGPSAWVKKWVDYSAKYGLGYLMSNGCYGVFFNDSTKVILHNDEHHFDYIERKSTDKQDVMASYTLTEYPKELQKKVTLLQHFRSYLEGDPKNKEEGTKQRTAKDIVYVKKWMRTRHAIMFRLSNKIVQVTFEDRTEIVLSSETKEVTYANKKGERTTYPLATALETTNMEMAKRLKYTKDILTHMLSSSQPHHSDKKPQAAGEKLGMGQTAKTSGLKANI